MANGFFSNGKYNIIVDDDNNPNGILAFDNEITNGELSEWVSIPTIHVFDMFMDSVFMDSVNEKKKVDDLYRKYISDDDDMYSSSNDDVPSSDIKIKKIREYINERVASLSEFFLSSENLFYVKNDYASNGDDGIGNNQLSMIHGSILNEQFNGLDIDKVNFIREVVSRSVKEGTCIYKIEWVTNSVMEKTLAPALEYLDDDDSQKLQDTIGNEEEQLYVTNERIVEDKPFIRFIDIDNFYFNKNIVTDEIVGYRFKITLENFINDERYKNKDIVKNNIDVLSIKDGSKYKTYGSNEDDSYKEFWVYEFYLKYDVKGNGHKEDIIVSIVGNIFVRMQKNYIEKKPFVFIKYDYDHRNKYGMSDIELLLTNQSIFNALVTGMLDTLARNSAGQRGVEDGFLTPDNRKKFESGRDYTYKRGHKPQESLYLHEYPPLTDTPFQIMNFFDQNAQNLTGIRPLHNTMAEGSATSARGVLDAISVRESYILSDIKNGIKKTGYFIAELNAMILSDSKLEEYLGSDKEKIALFREADGWRQIDIEVLTLAYRNMLLQNLSFLYQTTAQSASADERKLIQAEIAMLSNRTRLANMLMNVQPTPQEMEMQQLEIDIRKAELEKINAEIDNIKARAGENEIDQRLKTAKAMNEETKAKLNVSNADKIDSEFIQNMKEAKENKTKDKSKNDVKK